MNLQGWIAIVLLAWFPVAFAWSAARTGRSGGIEDRCGLLTGIGTAAIGLAIGRALVPWDVVSPALWAVAVAVAVWGGITAARSWTQLPTVAAARPRLRLATTALGLALSGAVVAALAG